MKKLVKLFQLTTVLVLTVVLNVNADNNEIIKSKLNHSIIKSNTDTNQLINGDKSEVGNPNDNLPNPFPISIESAEKKDLTKIKVYPVPAKDYVYINTGEILKENINVELFDITGKLMLTTTLIGNQNLHYLNLSNLPSGNYNINLRNYKLKSNHKIIVEKR